MKRTFLIQALASSGPVATMPAHLSGLPNRAVLAAPQGQLGLVGNYYAANHNDQNTAFFPKLIFRSDAHELSLANKNDLWNTGGAYFSRGHLASAALNDRIYPGQANGSMSYVEVNFRRWRATDDGVT